ncbi:MAG: glycosyltransferase family 4 protein [Candidatus Latescibacterota bacterium]
MKRVLFIAYYFPPMGLSGVQRTVKFLKYLPEFGWEPSVLTVKDTGYLAYDESLFGDLADEMTIVRTGSLDPLRLSALMGRAFSRSPDPPKMGERRIPKKNVSERTRHLFSVLNRILFIPDGKIGWLPFAVTGGSQLLSHGNFDVIYATGPPFTSHLIGGILGKLFHKPVVLDFRDIWENQFIDYPTGLHRTLNEFLQRAVLRTADAVVSNNAPTDADLRGRCPRSEASKFHVITHGFDPEDFRKWDGFLKSSGGKFTMTYCGAFYERRTPEPFLRAVRTLLDEHPAVASDLKAVFVGLFPEEYKKLVSRLDLDRVVEVNAYVPHKESIKYLLEADLLWFTISKGKASDTIAPGKLFEYVGAGKPILACVPEGTAAQTVRSLGNSTVVPPDDVNAIRDALFSYYQNWLEGKGVAADPRILDQYDRRTLTGSLADIFDACITLRKRKSQEKA